MSSNIKSFNGDPLVVNRYVGYQDPSTTTRFQNVGDEFYNSNTQVWFKAVGKNGNTYYWQAITTSPIDPPLTASNIIVGDSDIDLKAQSFPASGTAPLSAFVDFTSATIPYSAAAYTGLQLSYQPQDIDNGTIYLNVSIPVYAEATAPQLLSPVMLAFFGEQSGSTPIATMVVGTGGVESFSAVANFQFIGASADYESGLNLYVCAFFDSNVATADMSLVVNGSVISSVSEPYAYQAITGKFVETSPNSQ